MACKYPKACLMGGVSGCATPPPQKKNNSDFFLKNKGKEKEKDEKGCRRGYLLTYFSGLRLFREGLRFFRMRLKYFQGGGGFKYFLRGGG